MPAYTKHTLSHRARIPDALLHHGDLLSLCGNAGAKNVDRLGCEVCATARLDPYKIGPLRWSLRAQPMNPIAQDARWLVDYMSPFEQQRRKSGPLVLWE